MATLSVPPAGSQQSLYQIETRILSPLPNPLASRPTPSIRVGKEIEVFIFPLFDHVDQITGAGHCGQGLQPAPWEVIFQIIAGPIPAPAGVRGVEEILLVYADVGLTEQVKLGRGMVSPKFAVVPP